MKYGLLTVARHQQHLKTTGESLHVYLDGEDVTTQCVLANDVVGYVQRFMRDDSGELKIMQHRGETFVPKSMTRGDVVILVGAPFGVR